MSTDKKQGGALGRGLDALISKKYVKEDDLKQSFQMKSMMKN